MQQPLKHRIIRRVLYAVIVASALALTLVAPQGKTWTIKPHAQLAAMQLPASAAQPAVQQTCNFPFGGGTNVYADIYISHSGNYRAVTDRITRNDAGDDDVAVVRNGIGGSRLAGGSINGFGANTGWSDSRWEPAGDQLVIGVKDYTKGVTLFCGRS